MIYNKKAQTATEYLIILAVVIVIALIVVGVLGGIPSIGGGAGQSANSAAARTLKVGVESVVTTLYGTTFTLRNNMPNSVRLDNITIDGETCYDSGWGGFGDTSNALNPTLPKRLSIGGTLEITCMAHRYTADSDTSGTTSDDVYADGLSGTPGHTDSPPYAGDLTSKSIGDSYEFDVYFTYTDTSTNAQYPTSEVTLTSPIAGGVGYS